MNLFHHSVRLVVKHRGHHHFALATLALVLASMGVYTYRHEIARAATYTFTQSSWAGGTSATTATHASNQSNWTQYSANSTAITAGANGASLSATAFTKVDDGGGLSAKTDYTTGTQPYDAAVSTDGTSVYVTNYISNIVSMYPRNVTTGVLSAKTDYATGSHPYGVTISSDGTSVYVANFSSNTVSMYSRNTSTGTLSAKTDYTTGAGPRGVTISSNGTSVYVANIGANTVSMFSRNTTTGVLSARTDYTTGLSPIDVAISSDSTSVYVANVNSNTVSMFPRNTTTGVLSAKTDYTTGSSPQDVTIFPDGTSVYVTNYGSATVSMFSRNVTTGVLSAKTDYTTGANPQSVTISSDGTSVYVANIGANTVSMFSRTATAPGFESGTHSSTVQKGTGSGASVGLVATSALSTKTDYTTEGSSWGAKVSPDGTSVYVSGSTKVSMYTRNTSTGTLSAKTDYVAGSVPFGVTISSDGTSVYVANQSANTVSMYSRNTTTGVLSSKTDYATGSSPVGVTISPDGTSVYVTNSGSGTISMYTRNTSTGTLSAKTDYVAGSSPNGVTISPDGISVYVANSTSQTVSMFTRNTTSGTLSAKTDYAAGVTSQNITISADGTSVYVTNRGSHTVSMYSRNTSTGTLSAKTDYATGSGPTGVAISADGTLVYVANYTSYTVSVFPRNTTTGTLSAKTDYTTISRPYPVTISSDGTSVYVASSDSATVSMFKHLFAPSGTFTSAVINTGAMSVFTTLAYTTTLNGQTITMDARAGNTATPDGSWTAWQTGIASGGSIAGLAGNQYIQYRANLSTTNTAVTPTLDSVTINYSRYASSGNLTSSKYDSESPAGLISSMAWTATGTSGTEIVKFQVRTAGTEVGLDSAVWCGPTNCSGSDYFTTSSQTITNTALTDGANDQFFQYKTFLLSAGVYTPVLTSATIQYVVNGPPTVSNVTASQGSNGLITVIYDVSDADNSNNPQSVTATLQYCTTNCTTGQEVWADAVAVTGSVGAGTTLGTGKSIVWTPSTDYASQYKTDQKIRIKVNDGDAANNLAYGTSSAFTMDTTVPVVNTVFNSSGSQDVITITATDSSTPEYRLCNSACTNEAWTSITSGLATQINWAGVGAPSAETAYLEVRDAYSNTTSQTVVAPAMPSNFDYKDISNTANNDYWEFLSWGVNTNVPDSTFASYKVYHSIDGSVFDLLTTITDINANFYRHIITTATSSMQYYKVATVDTNGDISNYTATLSDIPNGQGGADTTAPTVSSIATPEANIRNTSAQITFTTDELSTSQALYGSTLASNCNFGTTKSSASYATSHSIYLENLLPNTTYYFCVKATDIAGNVSQGVAGTAFQTVGGPVITNVTTSNLTDISATVVWNTSTSSDSYVYYSTSDVLANPSTAGSATMVSESSLAGSFPHQVNLPSLSPGTRYYYYVRSTDILGNVSTDNNNGAYHSFVTTLDTTPPAISDIATPVISSSAAVIVWTTDEPATSQILWGTSLGDRSRYTTTDATKSIYHVVTLSSETVNAGSAGGTNALTAENTYYYVVKSVDTAGNISTSDEQTVTTPVTGDVTIVAVSVVNRIVNAPDIVIPDTTAPTVSNVKISDITPFEAAVGFETSEDAVSFVEYGKSALFGDNAGSKTWSKTHSIKLRGLTLGTDYHIKVSAVDKAGNTGTGSEQIFKTNFITEDIKEIAKIENIEQFQKEIEATIESILPSLVPPFITKPVISDITENSAKISFKSNIKAFPVVVFAEDSVYDETKENPYIGEMSDTAERATSHEFELTGLKGNTKYHIQARGFSLPKVIGKSADVEFITKTSKITGSIVERKKDSFTVVWTTEEPTSSIVEFKDLKRGIAGRKTDNAIKTSHSMKIENLPSGTAYEVNLSGVTEQGNVTEAGSPLSVRTSTDVTKPVISGFKVDNALVPGRTDRIQTIVSWVTDEPSNSVVRYEEGSGKTGDTAELANKNEILDSYTISHSVILPSLKPGTIYRLKVTSSDDSGNTGSFGPRTVITPKQTESITDIIFKNFEDSFKFLRKI